MFLIWNDKFFKKTLTFYNDKGAIISNATPKNKKKYVKAQLLLINNFIET